MPILQQIVSYEFVDIKYAQAFTLIFIRERSRPTENKCKYIQKKNIRIVKRKLILDRIISSKTKSKEKHLSFSEYDSDIEQLGFCKERQEEEKKKQKGGGGGEDEKKKEEENKNKKEKKEKKRRRRRR